ncbi:hypothetical protein [Lutibacter sp. B1]|uniref:hypothetical protein n=1 Tax=Lutibacter sp. B1 TaxID=2725996 RepID=UPI001456781E|nr:hypothetical protein [Lutibacter sp. B1]NLP58107.1 hypothetical protein [Lutibacter sp. B1]
MNKVLATFLSFIVLIQSFNFDVCDIDKIPTLIGHFTCHIQAGDSISDFFEMHYGSLKKQHEDKHKEHEKLPFKHQQLDTHFQLVFIICGNNNYPNKYTEFINAKNNFAYKEPSTHLFTNSFFQPPKQA